MASPTPPSVDPILRARGISAGWNVVEGAGEGKGLDVGVPPPPSPLEGRPPLLGPASPAPLDAAAARASPPSDGRASVARTLETIPLESASDEPAPRGLERWSVRGAQALCRYWREKVRAWAIARTGWGRLVSHTSSAAPGHPLAPYAHKHVITYVHAGQSYRVVFPDGPRGPCSIRCVETWEREDVTEDVMEKLGPFHNFHGIPTTPGLLGYTRLHFHCLDETKTYDRDDVIAPADLRCAVPLPSPVGGGAGAGQPAAGDGGRGGDAPLERGPAGGRQP